MASSGGKGYDIRVQTRDCNEANTDSDVWIVINGKDGRKTKDLKLDNFWRDDFEKGKEDSFHFDDVEDVGVIEKVELWRENCGKNDKWFCEYVKVLPLSRPDEEYPFPCHQWISPKRRYKLYVYNFSLPQLDHIEERKLQREQDVREQKIEYAYDPDIPLDLPRRVKTLPPSESFSTDYSWDMKKRKLGLFIEKKFQDWFSSGRWETFGHMRDVYQKSFHVPKGMHSWDSDESFGDQRLNGLNTTQLRRCNELPSDMPVTDDMVQEFLEGLALQEAMDQNRIFMVDYTWLDGIPTFRKVRMPAPFALFYANNAGKLMPLAIKIFPGPTEDNPVFLASDPKYTWLLAKMYFNLADASVHQSCNHLGFTHMVVESVSIALHQSLPPCHPVYQLMSPHFLYLFAINCLGLNKLLDPGGWFDTSMTIGALGFTDIIRRKWKTWRFDVDCWYPEDIKSRGVDDKNVLRHFHCRDDALLLHEAIVSYVTDVLTKVYDTPEKLLEDHEIQEFGRILVADEGAHMQGVPGGGKFENLEDLIKVLSGTIFTGSVVHAATNFSQYDEYAFPPNYPAMLSGEPPKDKSPKTEQDIVDQLPDKDSTLMTMIITHLLSSKNTESLGYFDIPYLYEPESLKAVERFQEKLEEVGKIIDKRNEGLDPEQQWDYLHPRNVPNAISI